MRVRFEILSLLRIERGRVVLAMNDTGCTPHFSYLKGDWSPTSRARTRQGTRSATFRLCSPALDFETQDSRAETRDPVQRVYVSNPESFASQIQN